MKILFRYEIFLEIGSTNFSFAYFFLPLDDYESLGDSSSSLATVSLYLVLLIIAHKTFELSSIKHYHKHFIWFNSLTFNIVFKKIIEVQFKCKKLSFQKLIIKIKASCWSFRLSLKVIKMLNTEIYHWLFRIIQFFSTFINFLTCCTLLDFYYLFLAVALIFLRQQQHDEFSWPSPENLLTLDTCQSPNCLIKIQSASFQWCCQPYIKYDTFSSRAIAHTGQIK